MNDAAKHFGFHGMYLEKCISEQFFDRMGYLAKEGMAEFRKEIDNLIELFDCDRIKLLPHISDKEKHDYIQHKKKEELRHSISKSRY